MKIFLPLLLIISLTKSYSQDSVERKYNIYLTTYEKTKGDTIMASIIDVFSGGQRIASKISDFDGIAIFSLKANRIVDNKINVTVYGPKCEVFVKEYKITGDFKTNVDLKYGETDYLHHRDVYKMMGKLKIPIVFEETIECGTEDPPRLPKN